MSEQPVFDIDAISGINNFQPKSGHDNDIKSIDEQEAERFKQDTRLRKCLANWTMTIISVWLIAVLAILIFCRHLDNQVLITLLATTTINILGLPKIILEGLFKESSRVHGKKNNSSPTT